MSVFNFCCKLWIYLIVGTFFNLYSMWNWLLEPQGIKCKFKPIGGNNTGIKALAYGPRKTEATTMARAMFDIGLNSYHSDEFFFHVWSPLTDLFYYRPENGGRLFGKYRLATPWPPANSGHRFHDKGGEHGSDMKVLKETSPEDFAAAISQCRVEAMVFDGFENVFEPVYKISPDAKVIVLDKRTFEEYKKSLVDFNIGDFSLLMALNFMTVSMHILPWNIFVFPGLDPFFGGPIQQKMRNGASFHKGTLKPQDKEHPLAMLWRMQLTERRVTQHWKSGFGTSLKTEEDWNKYWDWVKTHVPAERRFQWNTEKHGYKDLCKFLNINGNPMCNKEGPIKYEEISIMHHELENKKSFAIVCFYLLLLHLVSYHIFWYIVPFLYRKLMSPLQLLLPESKSKAE